MTTPIRAALVPKSFLQDQVRDGLRALKRRHLSLIEPALRPEFADRLDIDEAFREGHEGESRWDYLLGHTESHRIVGLEPHTANNHEVSTVIKKRARALEQLASHLRPGARVTDWLWVASGRVDFLPIEKAHLRLASSGIRFVGTALLKKCLPSAPPAGGGRKASRARL